MFEIINYKGQRLSRSWWDTKSDTIRDKDSYRKGFLFSN